MPEMCTSPITGNGRIRKVDTSGIITTVVGRGNGFDLGDGGPATEAQLANPSDVAVDGVGNIYIVDFGNSALRKVDTTGTIHSVAGVAGATSVAVDAAGNVYITVGDRVSKVDGKGKVTTYAGGGGDLTGNNIPANTIGFGSLRGVAVDGAGNVYILDNSRGKVFKVAATAAATPVITSALNGASFGSGAPLVQGSLASLFGTALAPTAAFAPTVPLPPTLAGVSVTIGGIAAPLLFVSQTQINLQVPWNLQLQAQDIIVKVNGTVSAAFSAMVGSVVPSIFTTQYGVGQRSLLRRMEFWYSRLDRFRVWYASGQAWRHDYHLCYWPWFSATAAPERSGPWGHTDANDHQAHSTDRGCGCRG